MKTSRLFAAVLGNALVAMLLTASAEPVTAEVSEVRPPEQGSDLNATWETQPDARTLVLTVPAPRGQIVDRGGRPLALSKVAYFPGIQFPIKAGLSDDEVLRFAEAAMLEVNHIVHGTKETDVPDYWTRSPADLIQHYQNRRWLAYQVAEYELSDNEKAAFDENAALGLSPIATYLREYPEGQLASHIIGYVGRKQDLPTGPIDRNDPMFLEYVGRSGLEASMESYLRGTPGELSIIYGPDGKEINRDMIRRPVPGNTVVTTLDRNMQKLAEDAIYFKSSMVVMDVDTGELLAMASEPKFNPNDFVPWISTEAFEKLSNDERNPLFGRAFQAAYPPASTFKVPMAIAGLKEGTITSKSTYSCPPSIKIGKQSFKNWSKSNYGYLTVRSAIKLSCNPFFYQMGIACGAEPLISEARNFGFGQLTGVPLEESPGFLPTNEWMMKEKGHNMRYGDIANFSIGQGDTEATPLQVAQSFSGIATQKEIVRAQLIKQIQTVDDQIVKVMKRDVVGRMDASEKLLEPVRAGMLDVVHASDGTGKQGYNPYAKVAAKTGTAQWKGDKQMTWFAGFVPFDDPQYSFAVAYEGGASGGRTAAPIVKQFFTSLYAQRDPDRDMFADTRSPNGSKKSKVADEEDDGDAGGEVAANNRSSNSAKKKTYRKRSTSNSNPAPSKPVVKATPAPAPPKKRGLFSRLFGKKD